VVFQFSPLHGRLQGGLKAHIDQFVLGVNTEAGNYDWGTEREMASKNRILFHHFVTV
jgi:hypothetical protein